MNNKTEVHPVQQADVAEQRAEFQACWATARLYSPDVTPIAEAQGIYARTHNLGEGACRYKPFSDEWFDWMRGWGKV